MGNKIDIERDYNTPMTPNKNSSNFGRIDYSSNKTKSAQKEKDGLYVEEKLFENFDSN